MRKRTHIAHQRQAGDKEIRNRKNVLRTRFKRLIDNSTMPGSEKVFLTQNIWAIVKELEDMAFFKADRNLNQRIKELEWNLTSSSMKSTSKPSPKRTMQLKKPIPKQQQSWVQTLIAKVARFKGIVYDPKI